MTGLLSRPVVRRKSAVAIGSGAFAFFAGCGVAARADFCTSLPAEVTPR